MNKFIFIIIASALLLVVSCNKLENDDFLISDQDSYVFSTPEKQGMSSDLLNAAYKKAASHKFVDGIIIAKNGYIVGEEYFNGYNDSKPHNVKSVSKSILSAVAGIAIEQGHFNLNDKMLTYFPEYNNSVSDTNKASITIQHLLTMRMGIPEDYDNTTYADLYTSDNWIEETIKYPLKYFPGEVMSYNTFQTHLLSGIITKATKNNTFIYTTNSLFKPLSIDIDDWEQDPQGYYFGGNSMFFTPREMYLFGKLYLNNGKLNTTQIIPESWIDLSLTSTSNFSNLDIGAFKNYNYGYLWWLGEINDYELFLAYGYGGQLIAIFPNIDLIIVTTSNNVVSATVARNQEILLFDLISNDILPSIQ